MKMKNKFILKDEALFLTLISHAKHTLESVTKEQNQDAYEIAEHLIRYFKKCKHKSYTGKRANNLTIFLKANIEPMLEKEHSPMLHMLVTLDYLIREARHTETMMFFNIHKVKISNMLHDLETSEHRELLFIHYAKLCKLL